MRKGFTLVELSIVLVIIGLLIGGILAGQSLINSAKIQKSVRMMQQYDVAISLFEDKYRGLPGDSPVLNGIGDNDKILASALGFSATYSNPSADIQNGTIQTEFSGEIANFWRDLSISGLTIEGLPEPSIDASAGIVYGEHIPEFGGGAIIPTRAIFNNSNNAYIIGNLNTGSSEFYSSFSSGAVNFTDAIAIDSKLDDGTAETGSVISMTFAFDGISCSLDKLSDPTYSDNPEDCILFIGMQGEQL